MMKKLTKHGNSLALVIERPVLELLNIDPDTPLDVTTDGEVLMISPVRDVKRRQKLEGFMERVNQRYGRTLKNLAD